MMDIETNRKVAKWTKAELAKRALWELSRPFFAWSPRPLWGWRRFLLRLFGAKVGRKVQIHPSARVFIPWNLEIGDWSSVGFDALLYNLGLMSIGERVTISQRAHLCGGSHDYRDATMPLLKLPVVIEDEAWICSDAFVGPGVTVGARSVVGARAVVTKEVEAGVIMVGHPGNAISRRDDVSLDSLLD
ncbi:MAG: putative colanic acid biosynthesis acetyltransferase [Akkermansiaceae bacterium]